MVEGIVEEAGTLGKVTIHRWEKSRISPSERYEISDAAMSLAVSIHLMASLSILGGDPGDASFSQLSFKIMDKETSGVHN